MHTEKELLELAAKAAGVVGYTWSDEFRCLVAPTGFAKDGDFSDAVFTWDPLSDDGDALRLAVRLEIGIQYFSESVEASDYKIEAISEDFGANPCAATRRAIVRAAAEIWSAMQ